MLAVAACAPPPERTPAPGMRFDAASARRDAIAIARLGPRPSGSAAVRRARDLVAQRLSEAGLFVKSGSVRAKDVRRGTVGEVGIVVAELAGANARDVILVTTAFDGSSEGPDVPRALGPAALLGLARALRAGDRPRHAVLLVATESAGADLGVRAAVSCLRSPNGSCRTEAGPGVQSETKSLCGLRELCGDASGPTPSHGRRRVVAEIALEPLGLRGDAALEWAGAGAQPLVDAWARAADAPAGGAHLAEILPVRRARRPWPAVGVGTRRSAVPPGSASDSARRVDAATMRIFGQAVLDLVRSADADPDRVLGRPPERRRPAYVELPLHVVVPLSPTAASVIGWLALATALWALVRVRRALPALALSAPWGLGAAALSIAAMAATSDALAGARDTSAPLRTTPLAHVVCVSLSGLWVLLAWQRLGVIGPLRRAAIGLSQPAVLATLSVLALGIATAVGLASASPLVPLAALPLLVAAPCAVAVARAADRRGRFVAAVPAVLALALVLGPPLADVVALLLPRGRLGGPSHVELALGIAAIGLPALPALAAAATASVLRPGAGQLVLLAVVNAALAVWTITAAPATRAHPRRVVVTAVSDARPGRSVFLVDAVDAVHVSAPRARRPWFAGALAGDPRVLAVRAPDGLSAPPEVHVDRSAEGGRRLLLDVRLRSLRRAESLALVLPPRARILRASVPVVRATRRSPWIARFVAPPPAGVRMILDVSLPPGVGLGDLVAIDTGSAAFGPLVPRIDRAWPTRVVLRAAGVTPLDTVYATPPPPPTLPPDDPPLPPAGPEPWWSIMAHERYRRR